MPAVHQPADNLLPTTLGDAPGAIAVDKARVRVVDDGGLTAVWVPIVARTSDPLQDPEAKILATRWAKRVSKVEGGIVRTQGPMPDDGVVDPTAVIDPGASESDATGRSGVDQYLQLTAAMNGAAAKTRKGHVLFCLVRAHEAAY